MFPPKYKGSIKHCASFLVLRNERYSNLSFTLKGISGNSLCHETPRSIPEITGCCISHPLAHLYFTKESRAVCTPWFLISMISSMYRQYDVLWEGDGSRSLHTRAWRPERVEVDLSKTVESTLSLPDKSKLSLVLSVKDGEDSICQVSHHRIGSGGKFNCSNKETESETATESRATTDSFNNRIEQSFSKTCMSSSRAK